MFTFATCGWTLRQDEDGPAWMEWAAMANALHVAPATVAEAPEQKWVVERTTERGGVEWSTHVGAWTLMRIMGRYVLRAHVTRTYRVRTVYVPRTRYVFGTFALPCQHVRVGQANCTCRCSNTYRLPEQIVRVA